MALGWRWVAFLGYQEWASAHLKVLSQSERCERSSAVVASGFGQLFAGSSGLVTSCFF